MSQIPYRPNNGEKAELWTRRNDRPRFLIVMAYSTSTTATAIQKYDFLDGYFGLRHAQWTLWLVDVNTSLFAWWASSMIAYA